MKDAESRRLEEDERRLKNWKRWGPYLSERQWGTVREDYSPDGSCWSYFPHDHARSRAYRWGEDGLLGITDRQCRLCFAVALWNGKDPILKERLFGLTGPEGNHGEDVKECYFYLDSSPTHSYMRALYKYPQSEFPYAHLVEKNQKASRSEAEYELSDSGIFDNNRYFDVFSEYAKAGPDDIAIRITVANRAAEAAPIVILPTLWFRNSWSWGRVGEGFTTKPTIAPASASAGVLSVAATHPTLGGYTLALHTRGKDATHEKALAASEVLFTNNETNIARLFNTPNVDPRVKDGFHEYIVRGAKTAASSTLPGTKSCFVIRETLAAGAEMVIELRLSSTECPPKPVFGKKFDEVFRMRRSEMLDFYKARFAPQIGEDEASVSRQAYAGLLWSKQFYYYAVHQWIEGDPAQPKPAPGRRNVRNTDWEHLYNRDIISMPDKWEYPWYAAWDLAFHMIAFAKIDAAFAKEQMILLLREWYMHPNGQIPAYEFAFSDVNPPVHAYACWRIYKITAAKGKRDRSFLARVFHKLLINFTWWVNRKDVTGRNLFSGGFLGLDNIGIFDRSQPVPGGGHLEQADATAWMAFYCSTMLAMALELASEDRSYEDIASKFFEHFVAIVDAINNLGGTGLWDELDGFYYDQINTGGTATPLRIRSLVGVIPLFAVEVLDDEQIDKLPGFKRRMQWFLTHRRDLAQHISYMEQSDTPKSGLRLLAIPTKQRLERMLHHLLNENEFLSPYGIRSLSRVHKDQPYTMQFGDKSFSVCYTPGESTTAMFGGNSNWRGPVWFPLNMLLIEALERFDYFYGENLTVECPIGSGKRVRLRHAANEIAQRLSLLFLRDEKGRRPCHGADRRFAEDPHWRYLVLFHEYFHGDSGLGLGANHQTGWTALVARCIERIAYARNAS